MNPEVQKLIANLSREIINPLITLMFAGALAYFVYGVIKFIAGADNEEARKTGKKHLLYSVLGLVIMVGVWGIIQIIINTLGVSAPAGYNQL